MLLLNIQGKRQTEMSKEMKRKTKETAGWRKNHPEVVLPLFQLEGHLEQDEW